MGRRLGWERGVWSGDFMERLGISAVAHLLAMVSLSTGWWIWAKPMAPAGAAYGSRVTLMYRPGERTTSLQEVRKNRSPAKSSKRIAVLPRDLASAATVSRPAEVAADPVEVAGTDARGAGAASILLIQAFPKQTQERLYFPAGTDGDVVVDVQIDSLGRVVNARTKRGMGHAIDEVVVATVEQWIFSPATKDGKPTMSEQELHFHYDRGNDPTCGWTCFTLEAQ